MGFAAPPRRFDQNWAVSSVDGVGSALSILSRMEMVGPVRAERWSPIGTLRKREPPDPLAMLYNEFVIGSLRPEIAGRRVDICLRIFDGGG